MQFRNKDVEAVVSPGCIPCTVFMKCSQFVGSSVFGLQLKFGGFVQWVPELWVFYLRVRFPQIFSS